MPPEQTEFLRLAIGDRVAVEIRVVPKAGHFSFMNAPPPQTIEPLANRERFLADLAVEVGRFVCG